MKKTSKLLGLIIFLLLLVISGCRNQDDLSLDNVGLESNNSRGEPWPNVLIWYKTDKRMIDANDNFSLRFSFSHSGQYHETTSIVPGKVFLNRQVYTNDNSFESIDNVVLKEIDNFSAEEYYEDVFTSNENTLEVNLPNEWFVDPAGKFIFVLYLYPFDDYSIGMPLTLYYKKIDKKIYFYTEEKNFKNNINE